MQHVSVHASVKISTGSVTYLYYTTGKLHTIIHKNSNKILIKSQENANDSFSF